MKLKKYRKKKRISSYISLGIIIIIISICFAFFIIDYFAKKSNEILLPMAESQVRKVITMIINSACDESKISDNLYEINKDNNDEIKMVTYNSFEVTKLINEVPSNVEDKIREIEMGNISHSQWKQFNTSGNKLNKNLIKPNKGNTIEREKNKSVGVSLG